MGSPARGVGPRDLVAAVALGPVERGVARRISASTVVTSGPLSAIPMLQCSGMRPARPEQLLAADARPGCAPQGSPPRPGRPRRSRPGTRRHRAARSRRSDGCRPAARPAVSRNASSPAAWPYSVVDRLETVEIDEQHHHLAPGPRGGGEVTLDHHQRRGAVQQPGQSVVGRRHLELEPVLLGAAHRRRAAGSARPAAPRPVRPGSGSFRIGRVGIVGERDRMRLDRRQRRRHLVERGRGVRQLAGAVRRDRRPDRSARLGSRARPPATAGSDGSRAGEEQRGGERPGR